MLACSAGDGAFKLNVCHKCALMWLQHAQLHTQRLQTSPKLSPLSPLTAFPRVRHGVSFRRFLLVNLPVSSITGRENFY